MSYLILLADSPESLHSKIHLLSMVNLNHWSHSGKTLLCRTSFQTKVLE